MRTRAISWEIILGGLAFIGIAIFLLNRGEEEPRDPQAPPPPVDSARVPSPPLPPSIVIDLQNLESLKNLRNLQNLENLKNLENLEIELKNLDKMVREHEREILTEESTKASLDRSLENLREQLRKMENGNFNIRLQDNKVFINRRFQVEEAAWSEVSPGVYVYRRSFNPAEAGNMGLDLKFGNVNIVGSDSTGGEIVLQATGDVDDPELLKKNLMMRVNREQGNTTFSVSPTGHNLSDRINLEATVTVPQRTNFDVKTAGGHISVTHLQGEQNFTTSGGHITLNDIAGTSVAKTNGGHITGSNVDGNFELTTAGGHIRIEKASGKLTLNTGGGHIRIEELVGQASAKTSGGNISAGIQALNGPLDFSTSAGNISVLLPPSVNADITASGSNVNLDDAFDFSGSSTNGKVNGTINGGGVPITVQCGYGNVSISTHD